MMGRCSSNLRAKDLVEQGTEVLTGVADCMRDNYGFTRRTLDALEEVSTHCVVWFAHVSPPRLQPFFLGTGHAGVDRQEAGVPPLTCAAGPLTCWYKNFCVHVRPSCWFAICR